MDAKSLKTGLCSQHAVASRPADVRRMSSALHEHMPDVANRIVSATRLLILLDYDGTLSPIVDRPENAHLPATTKALLQVLGDCPNVSLAIVSGRSLSDVRGRVGLSLLAYAGNHGMELNAAGIELIEPRAAARRDILNLLCGILEAMLRDIPHVVVENKGLTAAVHFRLVEPERVSDVHQIVHAAVAAVGQLFRVATGHCVYEILPIVNCNKGTAVKWIRELEESAPDLSVYLGDDESDEAAFLELRDDITVRIGAPVDTFARYHLPGPADVERCLSWIAKLRANIVSDGPIRAI